MGPNPFKKSQNWFYDILALSLVDKIEAYYQHFFKNLPIFFDVTKTEAMSNKIGIFFSKCGAVSEYMNFTLDSDIFFQKFRYNGIFIGRILSLLD